MPSPILLVAAPPGPDLTGHWTGVLAALLFGLAYLAVMAEERLRLRKSQPMLLAAGAVWLLVGLAFAGSGDAGTAADLARANLVEFAELFLFLLVAMTYVNTIEERGVFRALRARLVGRGLSLRALFWATGALAFALSPVADNLTTALILGAVVVTLGEGRPRFVTLACINVVVAANAGGAFSPFGDITTLMVWQAGAVGFAAFGALLLPSLVSWLVPAALLARGVEAGRPLAARERVAIEPGGVAVALLFVGTIALTVSFHNLLHLPTALGMMAGLGLLKLYAYGFNQMGRRGGRLLVDDLDEALEPPVIGDGADGGEPVRPHAGTAVGAAVQERVTVDIAVAADPRARRVPRAPGPAPAQHRPLDVFRELERVEWDTLLFFYGVILCVGGLGAFGYLRLASGVLYDGLGATAAHVLVGVLSAVVDNVPVMFAVLQMAPPLPTGQWLLVTLTAGIGGSLLSVGSAAGVALMGQARGIYTFGAHLRWSWAIALGYAAGVGTHLVLNRGLF